jgi:hypothetical protein
MENSLDDQCGWMPGVHSSAEFGERIVHGYMVIHGFIERSTRERSGDFEVGEITDVRKLVGLKQTMRNHLTMEPLKRPSQSASLFHNNLNVIV